MPIRYIKFYNVDVFGTVFIWYWLRAEIVEPISWNFQVDCVGIFHWGLYKLVEMRNVLLLEDGLGRSRGYVSVVLTDVGLLEHPKSDTRHIFRSSSVSPANHHSTIAPYSSITAPRGVR
jgi:hypothetical protein